MLSGEVARRATALFRMPARESRILTVKFGMTHPSFDLSGQSVSQLLVVSPFLCVRRVALFSPDPLADIRCTLAGLGYPLARSNQGRVELMRDSSMGRRYFFEEPGGKCLNILSTPLSRFLMFLSELSESVSLELPLQISCLVLVSKRSTTTVPTLYVSVVVVASPKPPPPKRLKPHPPPKPS